jgi:hypothetical protein
VREALAKKVRGVAGLSDDVEPRLSQQPGDPLSEEDIVLADHHAHLTRHRVQPYL